jgi:hypothetical protein
MRASEDAVAAEVTEIEDRQYFCDAAKIALALAATALPFARSRAEEAERWLRILRVHGAVGNAMQALGLPEEPFIADADGVAAEPCLPGALEAVIAEAASSCRERGDGAITTGDLLTGVLATYGPAFEHSLAIRGTSAGEVLELVATPRLKP